MTLNELTAKAYHTGRTMTHRDPRAMWIDRLNVSDSVYDAVCDAYQDGREARRQAGERMRTTPTISD